MMKPNLMSPVVSYVESFKALEPVVPIETEYMYTFSVDQDLV